MSGLLPASLPSRICATVLAVLLFPAADARGQTTPGSTAAKAGFAGAVAATDGLVFVGEAAPVRSAGQVYVYRMVEEGDGWEEAARLTASDAEPGDAFGTGLAADESTLVVGSNAAVYLFESNDGIWSEVARLETPVPEEEGGFGRAVALDGDHLLVSAPMANRQAGAVHAWQRAGGVWSYLGALPAPDLRAASRFGTAVAVQNGRALVGAPMVRTAEGAVYAYQWSADGWTLEGELPVDGGERNDRLGSAVALTDGFAAVGAPRRDTGGMVLPYAWDEQSGMWAPMSPLHAFDADATAGFGTALAIGAQRLWVGAPGAGERRGALYGFAWSDDAGGWTDALRTAAPELDAGDLLGATLAAHGPVVIAGAVADDYGEGSAVILDLDPTGLDATRLVGDVGGLEPVTGDGSDCSAEGQAGVFSCQDVDLVSFLPVKDLGGPRGVEVNDIWGWTDPETGREWVIVGRTEGTSFVDVSDAAHPRYVGNLAKTAGASGSVWRDIKVYDDHAFIVSDGAGPHGMQVFDLTRLRDVAAGDDPVEFDADAHYDRIASAHNIVINPASGFAYTVGNSSGGETCGGGLHMIDIRNPKEPTFAGCFSDPQTGRASTGYTHDAQCVMYAGPDGEHQGKEICFGANETALSIADVSDKTNPIALARASYPNVGYSHQGWLTEDHRYFLLNDELDEVQGNVEFTRTLIWDVTDLDDPQMVREHFGTQKSSDHNLYVVGNLMYQSNYVSGLRVLDISDVENPVEVAWFDTVPWGENSPGFNGSWSNYPFFESGVVAVTSGQEGLFLLRVRPRGRPVS